MGIFGTMESIGYTIVASALLIVLGLVYFMINLWIVKVGGGLLGYAPGADWAVLTAALLTVGGVVGSSFRKK